GRTVAQVEAGQALLEHQRSVVVHERSMPLARHSVAVVPNLVDLDSRRVQPAIAIWLDLESYGAGCQNWRRVSHVHPHGLVKCAPKDCNPEGRAHYSSILYGFTGRHRIPPSPPPAPAVPLPRAIGRLRIRRSRRAQGRLRVAL